MDPVQRALLYPIGIIVSAFLVFQAEFFSQQLPTQLFPQFYWEFGIKAIATLVLLITAFGIWDHIKPTNILNRALKGLLITFLYLIMFGITLDMASFIFP